jgi:hypothetical protein
MSTRLVEASRAFLTLRASPIKFGARLDTI